MSKLGEHLALPAPPMSPTIALALTGSKKSKNLVTWALEKFANRDEGDVDFRLIHVYSKITSVPTPMGNTIPISEVRDDVAAAYRQDVKCQTVEMLKPFKKMCEKRKVAAEIVLLEGDNVANALAEEISRNLVNGLVIGVPSRRLFSRKRDLCSAISASVPSFCTVYVVSKGKLSSVRPSDSEGNASFRGDGSETTVFSRSSSGHTSARDNDSLDVVPIALDSLSRALSLSVKRTRQPPQTTITRYASVPTETSSVGSDETTIVALDAEEVKDVYSICRSSTDTSCAVNAATHSRVSRQASNIYISDVLTEHSFTDNEIYLHFEIEKLRAELRHVQEMYVMAQTETMDASRKLTELNRRRLEEAARLEKLELKEREARELSEKEKPSLQRARTEAERAKKRAGTWPLDETRDLAALALCFTELKRQDQPDLEDRILSALSGPRQVVDKAKISISGVPRQPPSHFICPLLKGVMKEPCVAADGYTYDHRAIEEWLEEHNTSPMTDLPLPNKSLLPNYTLYTAIVEWRSTLQ